jgi:hypothetical protein
MARQGIRPETDWLRHLRWGRSRQKRFPATASETNQQPLIA